MQSDSPIKKALGTFGWLAGMAALVAGVGYYVSTIPSPGSAPRPAATAPAPEPQAASPHGASPHGGAAPDGLQSTLQGESDPHLLALKAELARDPEDLEALLGVGYLYVKQREYAKAHGYYLRASQVDPKNLEARTHLGTVAYFLGDTDEALHHYEQVLALDPDYTVALFEMGAVLRYGKGDLQGAVDTWEHFLRLDPQAEEAGRIRELVAETKKLIASGAAGEARPEPARPPRPAVSAGSDDAADAPWPGENPS